MGTSGDSGADRFDGELPVDLNRLSEILGEDDEAEVLRVLGWFVDGIPDLVSSIDEALAGRDARALEDAAHAGKSAALNAAAPRLAALLRQIEQSAAATRWDALAALVAEADSEFDRVAVFCRNRGMREA